mgnify:CR=1 FL=1
MKKLILSTFAILLFSATTQAQLIKIGARGGLNTTTFNVKEIRESGFEVREGEAQFGFHAGIMTRVNLPFIPVYIQPEVLLTKARGQYEVTLPGSGTTTTANLNFSRLDIPMLVGYKFGPARVNVGPVASITLSENNGMADLFDQSFEQNFNRTTWGYQAGVGVDVWRLAIDLKYEGNLSRFGESMKVFGNDYQLDTRTSQVIFSMGYWF